MFELEEITASDGLIHQGIVSYPHEAGKKAVLWVHGLTSSFYSNTVLLRDVADRAVREGYAFGSFNTRGHDMITGIKKMDVKEEKGYTYVTAGAGYEVFEDCRFDIEGQIDFFVNKGYEKIYLLGHSTGANKVCFYAGNKPNTHLTGAILISPMSDRLNPGEDKNQIEENLKKCQVLVENGREDALVTGMSFFPMTAKRYISLIAPHSLEDQFGYGDVPPFLPYYEQIQLPLYVLFAGNDEYSDRSMEDIQKIFDSKEKTQHYSSEIVPNVLHNFAGNEKEITNRIFSWIMKTA